MRIKGYGAGRQAQGDTGRDRAASFRARHAIGERIRGRVLRREPGGLHWVQAGGEELLARLEVQAEPGDQLVFVVRALSPEIHLQALQGEGAADDLAALVQRFRAAREEFERHAEPMLRVLERVPPLLSQRREAFGLALAGDAQAAGLHEQAQALLFRVNALLESRLGIEARYEPWLLPGLRRHEIVRRAARGSAAVEAALSASLAGVGALEARLVTGPGKCGLRLFAEQPERTGSLQVELAALLRDGLHVEPEFLGLARLPGSSAGVLGELLGEFPGDTAAWTSGGLNTRV